MESDLELAATSFAMMSHSLTASELWAGASTAYRREGLQARSTKAAKKSHDMAAPIRVAPGQTRLNLSAGGVVALLAGAAMQRLPTLSLSVRTVESHLYAAFAKLGLTARDELTSVMAESVD